MLTKIRAAVLFSFKRIYSILSCVKQVVGGDVTNFLGEFTGKVLPGLISLGGLLVATVLEFSISWHHGQQRIKCM